MNVLVDARDTCHRLDPASSSDSLHRDIVPGLGLVGIHVQRQGAIADPNEIGHDQHRI
jgi:hypothetical protein